MDANPRRPNTLAKAACALAAATSMACGCAPYIKLGDLKPNNPASYSESRARTADAIQKMSTASRKAVKGREIVDGLLITLGIAGAAAATFEASNDTVVGIGLGAASITGIKAYLNADRQTGYLATGIAKLECALDVTQMLEDVKGAPRDSTALSLDQPKIDALRQLGINASTITDAMASAATALASDLTSSDPLEQLVATSLYSDRIASVGALENEVALIQEAKDFDSQASLEIMLRRIVEETNTKLSEPRDYSGLGTETLISKAKEWNEKVAAAIEKAKPKDSGGNQATYMLLGRGSSSAGQVSGVGARASSFYAAQMQTANDQIERLKKMLINEERLTDCEKIL